MVADRPQKCGHVDNIIPLIMYHKGFDAQEAVDEAVQMIQKAYANFRSLENHLIELGRERDIESEIETFLQGCKDCCIGLVQWT